MKNNLKKVFLPFKKIKIKKEKNKIIYLHIGMAKTGTTAIQNFLRLNVEKLNSKGFYYPTTGLLGPGHMELGKAFEKLQKKQDPDLINQLLKELRHEIDGSGYNKIIISCEKLLGTLNTNIFIKYFYDFEIHVILYFRSLDDWAESIYKQAIKNSNRRETVSFEEWIGQFHRKATNFQIKCEAMVNSFSKKNFHVLFYNKNTCLYTNFLKTLNLNEGVWEFPKSSEMKNISFSSYTSELIRKFNNYDISAEQHRELIHFIYNAIDDKSWTESNNLQNDSYLTLESRKLIIEKGAPFTNWIIENFKIDPIIDLNQGHNQNTYHNNYNYNDNLDLIASSENIHKDLKSLTSRIQNYNE